MHVLQLVSRFPPFHVGGIENAVYHLSRELVKKGHEVTVVTSSDSWGRVVEEIDGIKVKRLPCLFKFGYTSPFLPSFLLESIQATPCDIVHAHIPDGFLSVFSPLVSMIKTSPLVLTVHNFPLGETPGKMVLARVLDQLLGVALYHSSRIFVHNSSYILHPRLRGLGRKVRITPLGVDLTRFNPGTNGDLVRRKLGLGRDPIILFVSVLDQAHWYKGLKLLLRSMKHLGRGAGDARLVVVGSGDAMAEYRSYAGDIGVEDQVVFAGYVGESVLPCYYASSDLIVLPSTSTLEGFGLVVAEGMASGKPTVVSRIAGISDFLTSGYDSVVLGDLDEYVLAKAMSEVLEDSRGRRLMGRRARETAETRFNWARIAEQIMEDYRQIAGMC